MPYKIVAFLKKVAFSGVFFFLCIACENNIEDVKALTEKKAIVETVTNVESYYSQQAKVKAKLTTQLMKHYQTDSPYWEFPRSLHVDFYNDSTVVESKLDAHYGRFKENEHRVFLKDSVVVSNLKGDTLYCRELWWDQQKGLFYTDKPIRIHRLNHTVMHGIGLEAPQNFSSFSTTVVNGPVGVPSNLGLP